jgi:hypothetical protein
MKRGLLRDGLSWALAIILCRLFPPSYEEAARIAWLAEVGACEALNSLRFFSFARLFVVVLGGRIAGGWGYGFRLYNVPMLD